MGVNNRHFKFLLVTLASRPRNRDVQSGGIRVALLTIRLGLEPIPRTRDTGKNYMAGIARGWIATFPVAFYTCLPLLR